MIDLRDRRIAELNALVAQLQALVATQRARIEELEAQLAQNSSNSSRPPSSDTPAERLARSKPKGSGRPRGGQKGHKGHRRKLIPPEQVTRSKDLYPEQCGRCERPLAPTVDPAPVIHQVVEIPEIKPDVSEYRQHRQTCSCGHVTCAKLPAGVPTGMCGPRLMALIGLLTGAYHLSRRQGTQLLSDVLGVRISLGALTPGGVGRVDGLTGAAQPCAP